MVVLTSYKGKITKIVKAKIKSDPALKKALGSGGYVDYRKRGERSSGFVYMSRKRIGGKTIGQVPVPIKVVFKDDNPISANVPNDFKPETVEPKYGNISGLDHPESIHTFNVTTKPDINSLPPKLRKQIFDRGVNIG